MCDVGVLEIRIQLRVKMVKVDPFLWGDGQHVWMTLKFDLWLDLYGLQSDWWYTYTSEKKESQLGLLFPIYGKINHVPNHQPAMTNEDCLSKCPIWLALLSVWILDVRKWL